MNDPLLSLITGINKQSNEALTRAEQIIKSIKTQGDK